MFKKILVPTDGSPLAEKAATIAATMAKAQDGAVVGVYVLDPFPYIGIGDASAVGLQAYLAEGQAVAQKALQRLSEVCAVQGVPFISDTIERNVVYEGIIQTADDEQCDLIVMGSHGHRGVKALILGSVAQKVLTHTQKPVLIIK